jgi:hypothetical protein
MRLFLSDTVLIENAHTRIPSNSVKGVTIILFDVEVENECDWYIDDCGLYLRVDNEIKCRKDKDVEMASTRFVETGCLRGICMVENIEPH